MPRTRKNPFSLPGAPAPELYAELVDAAVALKEQYVRQFDRMELERPQQLLGFRLEGEEGIAWALLDFDLVSPEGLFSPGDQGFDFLDRIHRDVESVRPMDPATRDRRLLGFTFEAEEDVPDEELARLQSLGRSFQGEASWPVFSAAAEYEPLRSPTAVEAKRLLGLLNALGALYRDISATWGGFLEPSAKSGAHTLLVRRKPAGPDGAWSNRRVARPAPYFGMTERVADPAELLDDPTRTLLKNLPLDSDEPVQVDFDLVAEESERHDPDAWKSRRAYLPWLVTLHAASTGVLLEFRSADSLESRNRELVAAFVKHMKRRKSRFGAVHVDSPRAASVLAPLCADLGVPLRLHPVLVPLQRFREFMEHSYEQYDELGKPPEEKRTLTLSWTGKRLDQLSDALVGLLQIRGVLRHEEAGAWLAERLDFRLSDPAPLMRDLDLLPVGRFKSCVVGEELVFDPSLDEEFAYDLLEEIEERDDLPPFPLTLERAIEIGGGAPVWCGPEADAFIADLRADGIDPEDASAVVESLYRILNRMDGQHVVAAASDLIFCGSPDDASSEFLERRLKLFYDYSNAVPHWLDKGWSPRQLREGLHKTASPASATAFRAGRNDPCPCGSGKKFKSCHGANGV